MPVSPRMTGRVMNLFCVTFPARRVCTGMTSESSIATAGRSGWLSSPGPISIGAFAKAVLIVTAIAGTLDIIAAHLHIWAASGSFPTRVFKGIASGAIGRDRAMQGGADIVLLGIFFH